MERLRPWLRDHTWPYLALAAVLAVLGWRIGFGGGDGSGDAAQPRTRTAEPVSVVDAPVRDVLVHVAGEVRRPGLYRLPDGVRTMRAIRQAGGATRHADMAALNLAAPVQDGQRIVVPRRSPPGAAAPASTGAGSGADAGSGPISLSSATAEQLQTLDGIGPTLAARIVEWRDTHGGFGSVDDLDEVPGIGEARMEALRPKLAP